jgi:uncharacterized protein YciI
MVLRTAARWIKERESLADPAALMTVADEVAAEVLS